MSTALEEITWPARTARLSLRPARREDLEATWAFRRLPDVSRWLTRAPTTIEAYREQYDDPDRLAMSLVVELDGEVIGDLMLKVEDAWAQAEVADRARATEAELGWVLHPAHAGHGYATEAVRELVRLCFEELGLRRVTANCFADNEASWRLMERIGMRREVHAVRESLHRSGRWLDGVAYALLEDEWRDLRQAHPADPFDVVVGAGSFRSEAAGVIHLPHRWTAEGVSVEAQFTGAHLLHLSAAGCVLNDVYREAGALGIRVDGVRVRAGGGFDPDTWRSTGVGYAVDLASPAPDEDLQRLLAIVDEVAEIPRALRRGTSVRRVTPGTTAG